MRIVLVRTMTDPCSEWSTTGECICPDHPDTLPDIDWTEEMAGL